MLEQEIDAVRELDPSDAAWILMESSDTPGHVLSTYVFDNDSDPAGAMSTAELTEFLCAKTASTLIFRHRIRRVPLNLDLPHWEEDPHFDAQRHLHFHSLTGGWESLRNRLCSIAASPLDITGPPWELHVITGLQNIDGAHNVTAVALRMHHAMGDGLASVEIARMLFSDSTRDDSFALAHKDVGHGTASATALVARAVRRGPKTAAAAVRGIREVSAAAKEAEQHYQRGDIERPTPQRPRTIFNQRPSRARIFDAASFTVSEIRGAKALAPGTTVNDVMLTTVSRALERLLTEGGDTFDQSLAALVPMSTRGIFQRDSVNQFDPLVVDLFTTTPDLRERLAAIANSVRQDKKRVSDDAVHRSHQLLRHVPAPALVAIAAISHRWPQRGSTVSLTNTTITNVNRGVADLYLRQAQVISTYGAPALDEHAALCHGIYSIGDNLRLCFVSDPALLPNPGHYRDLLRESFDELAQALGSGAAPTSELG